MITVIFGDNLRDSRLYLSTLTSEKKTTVFTDENLDMTALAQAFSSDMLFAEKETFVFENLLSKSKSSEKEAILNFIKTNEKENDVVFWDGKMLTPTSLKAFPKATIKEFRLPQSLFQFMDSIRPGNAKVMLNLHHKTLESTEEEMVFYMLVRQTRLLLAVATGSNIEEVKRLRPWQVDKLSSQAKTIGIQNLKSYYMQLFDLDRKQKTGELSSPLSIMIDFFLSSI